MTNKTIMKAINTKQSTFYALKKRNPRLVELVEKGLLYEEALKQKAKK